MATDTSVPEIYQSLVGTNKAMLEHQSLHTTLLHAIHKRLEGIEPRKVPFRIQVPDIRAANGAPGLSAPILSANRGEILTVQNPTGGALTVDLAEDQGGSSIVIKVTVAAGDYKALFVPFFGRLFARGGTGMIISGNVFD